MMRILMPSLLLAASTITAAVTTAHKHDNIPQSLPNTVGRLSTHSALGKSLLKQSHRILENNNDNDENFDFIADYALKFQGCHHVTQWNENVNGDDDVRIKTKRLVRFRLCESCSSSSSSGCTSKYGDYVVDMNTYVSAYLQALQEDLDNICTNALYDCQDECGNNNDDCLEACFQGYDLEACLNNNDGYNDNNNKLDPLDYAWCAQFDGFRRRRRLDGNAYGDDDAYQEGYYIGPYCAAQGGEIHLGLFTDDTCTTFASNGESLFKSSMGYSLPYSEDSLISQVCLKCGEGNNNNEEQQQDEDREAEISELCGTVYEVSGKCESKMNVDYPNESACTYIEGIKIIREDGVIRTSQIKKSKAAAVCIGLFLTMAVLLAGYVMYLRTKLGRARVNLSAAAGTMA